jgi:hypothetical protein
MMGDNLTPPSRFNRAAFPHLAGFMRGYMHEDFAREHRTALAAARHFLVVASDDERMETAGDAARFALLTAGLSLEDIRVQLDGLGGAWNPRTRSEIDRLLKTLSDAGPDAEPPEPLRRGPVA